MPGAADVNHQRGAIEGPCAALTARGIPSRIVAWPETVSDYPLTVDAIAKIGGASAVIEHCQLTIPSTMPAGIDEARRALYDPIGHIAQKAGHALALTLTAPNAGKPPEEQAWYQSVLQLARSSAAQGPGTYHGADNLARIDVLEPPTVAGRPATLFFLTKDAGPSVTPYSEQVAAAMRHACQAKLSTDLPLAKAAGYLVALLIDQRPAAAQGVPSQFAAAANTVARAIDPLLSAHPRMVDNVWLRQRDGTYEPVSLPPTA